MEKSRLYARLRNWGDWLVYYHNITPDKARCTSIEAQHIPDANDIWEPAHTYAQPNVADAEAIERTLKELFEANLIGVMERYCLAVRYGGYAAVFRMRRIGDHAMNKLADNCEAMLYEATKRRA